jgi:hypothetical protein
LSIFASALLGALLFFCIFPPLIDVDEAGFLAVMKKGGEFGFGGAGEYLAH